MTTCKCCKKELTPNLDGGTRADCVHCGTINYVRLGEFDETGWVESLTLSKETVWALSIGGAGAWVVVFMDVPFMRFILNYFITLVHEFGHALMSIALGFPAVPAFDFTHGGGVTVTLDDANMGLRVIVFGALAFAVLYFRKYKAILLMPLSVMVFNFCCLKYGWEETAIVYMGHGTVLLMSCVFLFRGLSDVAVHNYLEKILYLFLGFLSVFSEFSFAFFHSPLLCFSS